MTTNRPMVIGLDEVDGSMVDLVGGKGANLGALMRHGFHVPHGFCVTTHAYAMVDDVQEPDPARRAAALLDREPPTPLWEAVLAAYRELGSDAPVAVRSSATAEDLPTASFAGLQDTVLNVVGAEQLRHALGRCWASLWSERAVSYRDQMGVDPRGMAMAVVVQRMVDAASAGVLFTADAVTGRRGRTLIEASDGLGETVVSGAGLPDRVVVDTETASVLERREGDRARRLVSVPGGGTTTSSELRSTPALTDHQALALAALGKRVEHHFAGRPQDLEWAYDTDGRLWLLQSRAITSLFPLPSEDEPGLRVYLSINTLLGLERPLTPMGVSVLREAVHGLSCRAGLPRALSTAFRDASGWLFFDITGAVRSWLGRIVAPRMMALGDGRSGSALVQLWDDDRLSIIHRTPIPTFGRGVRPSSRIRLPFRAALALAVPGRVAARAYDEAEQLARELRAARRVTSGELRSAVLDIVGAQVPEAIRRVIPVTAVSLLLSRLASRTGGTGELGAPELLSAVPENVSPDLNLALRRLAEKLGADPEVRAAVYERTPEDVAERYLRGELPEAAGVAVEDFLERHGHRAPVEVDVAVPRWQDDPAPLFAVLQNYVPAGACGHSVAHQHRASAPATDAALVRIIEFHVCRGRAIRALVRWARQAVGLREMSRNYFALGLAAVRRHLLQAGEDLVARGQLDHVEDVFMLTLEQVDAAARAETDLRDTVATARALHAREARRRHHPELLLSDGTVVEGPPGRGHRDTARAGRRSFRPRPTVREPRLSRAWSRASTSGRDA